MNPFDRRETGERIKPQRKWASTDYQSADARGRKTQNQLLKKAPSSCSDYHFDAVASIR